MTTFSVVFCRWQHQHDAYIRHRFGLSGNGTV